MLEKFQSRLNDVINNVDMRITIYLYIKVVLRFLLLEFM
jgi:hypothetical protein